MRRVKSGHVISWMALFVPIWSWAQTPAPIASGNGTSTTLDEVVVTANKLDTANLQKTPGAVTVFSADRLDASALNDIRDLVSSTPSLNVAQATASPEIYIRGIGSNNAFNGSDPDVTMQSDGVYIARPFAQLTDFLDIDRVEVLRGPQGTLYGRNAVGGTINVISRTPSDDFEAKALVAGGTYDLAQAQGYVSGPLMPGLLQASIAANFMRHDGYVENIAPGQPDVGGALRGGLRAQLRFVPSDSVEAITRADWSKTDEHLDAYSHLLAPTPFTPLANSIIGDYHKAALDSPQNEIAEIWGMSETIKVRLSDALQLQSITAYRRSDYVVNVDVDGTELPVIEGYQTDLSRQFSQEVNLGLHFERLEGVIGAYFFEEHEISTIENNSPPSVFIPLPGAAVITALPDSLTHSGAAYAQSTYHFTDALAFTAGVRYTEDRKGIDQDISRVPYDAEVPTFRFIASPTPKDYVSWTPKFGLEYQLTPDILVYGSATKGYKSGGTNFAATSLQTLTFAPEKLWSYEGGLKSDWLDRKLRVNLTGFYYDYSDLQVQSLIGPGVVSISNAASAIVRGIELETAVRPLAGLSMGFNYSFLNARYDRFPDAAVPSQLRSYLAGTPQFDASAGTFDASGNRLDAAPASSASLSAQYDLPLGPASAFCRVEYYWQSRVYYDPSNAPIMSQGPYGLLNLSTGYEGIPGGWSVRLIAKNVANTQYLTTVAANGLVPAGLAGYPRTVELQLAKHW
jgi:iron complex outermembrane receptor protein